jgi:hypothetical protein
MVQTTPVPAELAFALWAEAVGWVVTKRGWPDFICYREKQLMAVEVKAGKDGLRVEQVNALSALNRAGIPTYVWTRESGLRPFPGPIQDVSLYALEAQFGEMQRQLSSVLRERDHLQSEVDRLVEANRKLTNSLRQELDRATRWKRIATGHDPNDKPRGIHAVPPEMRDEYLASQEEKRTARRERKQRNANSTDPAIAALARGRLMDPCNPVRVKRTVV